MQEMGILIGSAIIQSGPILLAALLAYLGVTRQINGQRKLIKQNNSINAMLALQKDGDLMSAMNLVAKISTDEQDSVELYASSDGARKGDGKNGWDEERRNKSHALSAVVNYFETVSIGIRQNIYDEEIIRVYAGVMFVEMYKRTRTFIIKMQEEHYPAYGENFQSVAEEFQGKK